jgi:hypothetical protein
LKAAPADLHLAAGSPAIGEGAVLDTALMGTKDADGEARIQGGKPDLGADEVSGTTSLATLRARIPVRAAPEGSRYRDGLGRALGVREAGPRYR